MSWDKLWAVTRQVIDHVAPRYNAIRADTRVLVKITNAPDKRKTLFVFSFGVYCAANSLDKIAGWCSGVRDGGPAPKE